MFTRESGVMIIVTQYAGHGNFTLYCLETMLRDKLNSNPNIYIWLHTMKLYNIHTNVSIEYSRPRHNVTSVQFISKVHFVVLTRTQIFVYDVAKTQPVRSRFEKNTSFKKMLVIGVYVVGFMIYQGELAVYSWNTSTDEFLSQDELVLDMKKANETSFITCDHRCVHIWDAATLTKKILLDLERTVIFHDIEWLSDITIAFITEGPTSVLKVWNLEANDCIEHTISTSRMIGCSIAKINARRIIVRLRLLRSGFDTTCQVIDVENGEMVPTPQFDSLCLQHGFLVSNRKEIYQIHNMNVSMLREVQE